MVKSTPILKRKLLKLSNLLFKFDIKTEACHDSSRDDKTYFNSLSANIFTKSELVDTAEYAKRLCNIIVIGALHIMSGGSKTRSISVVHLVRAALCDVLVSDYYYLAMTGSIWSLHANKIIDFAKAWSLISSGPISIINSGTKDKLELSFAEILSFWILSVGLFNHAFERNNLLARRVSHPTAR